jgi:uncharacterized cupredoxin-like copper-binding protein
MNPILAALLVAMAGVAAAHTGPAHAPAFDASKAEETRFGQAADPAKASRVVRVAMSDTMRFSPASLTVKRGETVRFVVKNEGKLMHEMVLGTPDELRAHAEAMRRHHAMGQSMEHEAPNMLHVAPGRTGEMGWRFTRAGEFRYGCLVPGHFEAGMVGKIVVRE